MGPTLDALARPLLGPLPLVMRLEVVQLATVEFMTGTLSAVVVMVRVVGAVTVKTRLLLLFMSPEVTAV